MALIFMDGFDLYTTSSQLIEPLQTGVTPVPKARYILSTNPPTSMTVTSSGGRFGGGRLVMDDTGGLPQGILVVRFEEEEPTTVIAQFACKWDSLPGSDQEWFRFINNSSNGLEIVIGTAGDLSLKGDDNGVMETSATGIITTGSWNYFQIKATAGAAGAGSAVVNVNGVEIFNNVTGSFNPTGGVFDRINFVVNADQTYSVDDLVILDTTGQDNNDFLGDVIIQTLVPDAAGSSDDWVPRAEASPWNQVNDTVPGGHDGQTTRAHSPDQGDKSLFSIGDFASPASPAYVNKIHGVQVNSTVTNKMFSWEDPIPTYQNSTSFNRYIWPSASQTLVGPFTANNQAVAFFDDKFWFQAEGSRTNLLQDMNTFAVRGTCGITASQADPLGGTDAYKLEGVDTGNNDAFKQTAGGTNDAPYELNILFKKITAAGTLSFLNPINPNIGTWHIDLALLSSDWEMITSAHPAVTEVVEMVLNPSGDGGMHLRAVSGGPLDFYVFWPQMEEGLFPSSPVSHSATRSTDRFVWDETDVPIAFYTGSWTTSFYAEHTSNDITGSGTPHYLYWLNATNNLCLSGAGSDCWAKLATTSGDISQSITYGPSDKVDFSVDFAAGSITIAGAATGNGTTAGTISDWPSATGPYIGSDNGPANHFYGLISEPTDDTGDETSFRQRVYLSGVENSGSSDVPVINAPTGFGGTSDVFETRPDTSGSWTQAALNNLQAGFEHV